MIKIVQRNRRLVTALAALTLLIASTLLVVASDTPKDLDEPSTSDATVLRAQLQLMKDFDQRLLATVYWSLGVVLTLSIVLVGYSWFTNFRIYERDKAALRAQISTDLNQAQISLRSEVQTAGEQAVQHLRQYVDSRFSIIDRSLLEREAADWESQKVYSNAIYARARALNLSITTDTSYKITEDLEQLRRLLTLINPKTLNPGTTAATLETVDKLPARSLSDLIREFS